MNLYSPNDLYNLPPKYVTSKFSLYIFPELNNNLYYNLDNNYDVHKNIVIEETIDDLIITISYFTMNYIPFMVLFEYYSQKKSEEKIVCTNLDLYKKAIDYINSINIDISKFQHHDYYPIDLIDFETRNSVLSLEDIINTDTEDLLSNGDVVYTVIKIPDYIDEYIIAKVDIVQVDNPNSRCNTYSGTIIELLHEYEFYVDLTKIYNFGKTDILEVIESGYC